MENIVGLVYYTKPWSMEDERTGNINHGITVMYLATDTLMPVTNDDGSRGVKNCKESIPSDKISSIKEVPGYYNLKYTLKPGTRGKMELKLGDIEFISPVVPAAK